MQQTYVKLDETSHALARPDNYIGSVEISKPTNMLVEEAEGVFLLKKIQYNPGLLKLFDEIVTNALDNSVWGKIPQKYIKIWIDNESGMVSV